MSDVPRIGDDWTWIANSLASTLDADPELVAKWLVEAKSMPDKSGAEKWLRDKMQRAATLKLMRDRTKEIEPEPSK
jgi:hypothetical protein